VVLNFSFTLNTGFNQISSIRNCVNNDSLVSTFFNWLNCPLQSFTTTILSLFDMVRVKQRLHFPLSTTYLPLLSAFRSMFTFCPNDNVSMGVTLACYQQAGSGGKYIDVSGKWSRWFTLTLFDRSGNSCGHTWWQVMIMAAQTQTPEMPWPEACWWQRL